MYVHLHRVSLYLIGQYHVGLYLGVSTIWPNTNGYINYLTEYEY